MRRRRSTRTSARSADVCSKQGVKVLEGPEPASQPGLGGPFGSVFLFFFLQFLQEDMFLNSISFPSDGSHSAGNVHWSPAQTRPGWAPQAASAAPLRRQQGERMESCSQAGESATSSIYCPRCIVKSLKFCYFEGILV